MSMTSNASFIVLICILLSSGDTFAELGSCKKIGVRPGTYIKVLIE